MVGKDGDALLDNVQRSLRQAGVSQAILDYGLNLISRSYLASRLEGPHRFESRSAPSL